MNIKNNNKNSLKIRVVEIRSLSLRLSDKIMVMVTFYFSVVLFRDGDIPTCAKTGYVKSSNRLPVRKSKNIPNKIVKKTKNCQKLYITNNCKR